MLLYGDDGKQRLPTALEMQIVDLQHWTNAHYISTVDGLK